MEAEYQATIAAMQKQIEELQGTKKQWPQMYVSIVFFVNFVDPNGNHHDGNSAKGTEFTLFFTLIWIFFHVENIENINNVIIYASFFKAH